MDVPNLQRSISYSPLLAQTPQILAVMELPMVRLRLSLLTEITPTRIRGMIQQLKLPHWQPT